MLARVQNDLFDVGSDLCVPGAAGDRLRLTDAPSARLEAEVAAMNADLPPLDSFILPGGTPAAAHAHLARTVVRRAERLVVRWRGRRRSTRRSSASSTGYPTTCSCSGACSITTARPT